MTGETRFSVSPRRVVGTPHARTEWGGEGRVCGAAARRWAPQTRPEPQRGRPGKGRYTRAMAEGATGKAQ